MTEFDQGELARVVCKIKDCLALSSDASEQEVAVALHQVQEVMRKYRLTESDMCLSDVGKTEGETAQAERRTWDRTLSVVVAETFHCQAYSGTYYCKTKLRKQGRAVFIGIIPAPELAKFVYDALLSRLRAAKREHVKQIHDGQLPPSRFAPETRGNQFAAAWIATVQERLKALSVATDLTVSEQKTLATVESQDDELIGAFFEQITDRSSARKGRGVEKSGLVGLLLGAVAPAIIPEDSL